METRDQISDRSFAEAHVYEAITVTAQRDQVVADAKKIVDDLAGAAELDGHFYNDTINYLSNAVDAGASRTYVKAVQVFERCVREFRG